MKKPKHNNANLVFSTSNKKIYQNKNGLGSYKDSKTRKLFEDIEKDSDIEKVKKKLSEDSSFEKQMLNLKLENQADEFEIVSLDNRLLEMCDNSRSEDIMDFVRQETKEGNVFDISSWKTVFNTFKDNVTNVFVFKEFADVCKEMGFTKREDDFSYEEVIDETCDRFNASELEVAFFRGQVCPYEKVLDKTVQKADLPVITNLMKDISINNYEPNVRSKFQEIVARAGVLKMDESTNLACADFVLELDKANMAIGTKYEKVVTQFFKNAIKENDDLALCRVESIMYKLKTRKEIEKDQKETKQINASQRVRGK